MHSDTNNTQDKQVVPETVALEGKNLSLPVRGIVWFLRTGWALPTWFVLMCGGGLLMVWLNTPGEGASVPTPTKLAAAADPEQSPR